MARKARLIGVSCAVFLGLVVPLRAAGIDEATETFNALYAADLARVRGTGGVRDDVELAARLLAAAKRASGQPAFLTVLCEKAYDLALRHPTGYGAALEAMDLLARTVPEKATACAARTFEIREKQYEAAQGDEKKAAGELLLNSLLPIIEAKQKAGELAEAAALYRKARTIAAASGSPRADEIDARAAALAQRMKIAARIADVKALLARDSANVSAREGLVRIYLVVLDDPAEAAKHLKGVVDKALLKYVPAAAKGLEAAPEFACLELGEWYARLAAKAPKHAGAAMYARAKAYLQRFLKIHTPKDLNRTRATLALEKIEQAVARLAAAKTAAAPSRPSTSGKGTWMDLLALVDPTKDKVEGSWQRTPGGLAAVQRVRQSRITIPVAPEGSYELQLRFARTEGGDAIATVLPVGPNKVILFLCTYAGKAHGLSDIRRAHAVNNETTVNPGTIENGRDHSLQVRVDLEDEKARIHVGLNGRSIIDWEGDQSDLSARSGWDVPQAGCLGVGANNAIITWRSARLRMLSGEARLLRPAGCSRP